MKTIPPALVMVLLSHPAAALPRYVGVELVKSEPEGVGPIPAIFAWLESSLLGNAAALAVVVMAMAGLMMLTRRTGMRLDGLEKLSEQPAAGRGAAVQSPSREP